jgi:hypothetical protein
MTTITIPVKNYIALSAEALIGCLAVTGGIAYGIYRITDKYIFSK